MNNYDSDMESLENIKKKNNSTTIIVFKETKKKTAKFIIARTFDDSHIDMDNGYACLLPLVFSKRIQNGYKMIQNFEEHMFECVCVCVCQCLSMFVCVCFFLCCGVVLF